MIAVPLSPPVEWEQEQVGCLEAAQPLLGADAVDDRVAQRCAQLINHRGATQEALILLGKPAQRLPIEVVGHIPVVAGDRQPVSAAVTGDQRGKVQADRPSFGASSDVGRRVGGEGDRSPEEDLFGAGRVEREVARPNSTASPDARSRGR